MANNLQATTDEQLQQTEDLIALLEQRSATYALLARLYLKEIDQELLDEMHSMLYPVSNGDENMDEGYHLIATYLSNLWDDSLNELAIDYVRCFTGYGMDAYSAAYPYESVYTSEKRLLMQDARNQVQALYRAYGVDKVSSWKEGEDHVSLELEFERILCDYTIKALRQNKEQQAYDLLVAQLNFLDDHLCSWVPMMTADMLRFAQTKMYQGLAYLTEGFLDFDYVFLKDLLSENEEGAQD